MSNLVASPECDGVLDVAPTSSTASAPPRLLCGLGADGRPGRERFCSEVLPELACLGKGTEEKTSLVVKNTFITVEPEEQVDIATHRRSSRTYTAPAQLLKPTVEVLGAEAGVKSTNSADISMISTEAGDSGSEASDAEPPVGTRVTARPCEPPSSHLFPPPPVGPVPRGQETSLLAPGPYIDRQGQVLLQIPLQVSSCGPQVPEDLEAVVTNLRSAFEDGHTVIDLRVVLAPRASLSPSPPDGTASGGFSDAGDAGTGSFNSLSGAVCSPSTFVSEVSPSGQISRMSHMVCCHWKNKGWCKFQATCRFQHPADKRGVGKSLRVHPRQAKKGASGSATATPAGAL